MFWECMIIILLTTRCVVTYLPDEIQDLPGLNEVINFRHYSGYLNASNGKYLHYWFVESQKYPEYDPVILWMNGGPGCSSMQGLFNELGPFHVGKDGQTLSLNPFSWNKRANIIFLESPAKVGYSFSDDEMYTMSDDIACDDHHLALEHFFRKFPQFKYNDFYIAGENYAGVYVPMLSLQVFEESPDINLKGFIIGNGYLDATRAQNSVIFYAYYHGLIGQQTWDNLVEHCCNKTPTSVNCSFVRETSFRCQQEVEFVEFILGSSGLNYFSLYSECQSSNSTMLNSMQEASEQIQSNSIQPMHEANSFVPWCLDLSNLTHYLNQPSVRRALHIPSFLPPWGFCNNNVHNAYNKMYDSMRGHILELIELGLRGLIYNGDVDMTNNFLGDEWFVEDLARPISKPYRPWFVNNQLAGFTKRYGQLTFATIKGAGQMVAKDKPEETLEMILAFLKNYPL